MIGSSGGWRPRRRWRSAPATASTGFLPVGPDRDPGPVAVVAASAAAWWPARTMSRLPVTVALSRRPVRAVPVRRSLGLAVRPSGARRGGYRAWRVPIGDTSDRSSSSPVWSSWLWASCCCPGRHPIPRPSPGRLPFVSRLAIRDLVRHQGRAAAALAAITLGLSITVSIVVVAKASEFEPDEGNLSSQELIVRVGDLHDPLDPRPAAQVARLDAAGRAGRRRRPGGGGAPRRRPRSRLRVTWRGGGDRPHPTDLPRLPRCRLGLRGHPAGPPGPRPRPVRLPHRRGPPHASHRGPLLLDTTVRPGRGEEQATRTASVDLAGYTSAPSSLIAEEAVRAHGGRRPGRRGWSGPPGR